MADREQRLSSWRQVAQGGERSLAPLGETGNTEALLRAHQRRVATLCRNSVMEHMEFFADLLDFARQEGRDPQLQQRIADFCTYALRIYEANSAKLLEMSVEEEIKQFFRACGYRS
jgi:hypothetical protein